MLFHPLCLCHACIPLLVTNVSIVATRWLKTSLGFTWSHLQSASLEYFRTARSFIKAADREHLVRQALVNPCGDAWFNVYSNMGNAGALNAFAVRTGADIAMEATAAAVKQDSDRMSQLLQSHAAAAATSADGTSCGEDGGPITTRAATTCTLSAGMPCYSLTWLRPHRVFWHIIFFGTRAFSCDSTWLSTLQGSMAFC